LVRLIGSIAPSNRSPQYRPHVPPTPRRLTGGYAALKEGWKAKEALVDRAVTLFRTGVLQAAPVETYPLSKWREALAAAERAHRRRGAKVMLTMDGGGGGGA
jgi:hypothetical protein